MKGERTLVRKVHRVRRADVDARDEVLVDKLVYFVEGFQYHLGRKEDLTRAVHDEEGAPLAALE